ncbi:MAG: hypothetical protein J6M47_06500 [Clostridia bacterium]|nr:hypothetical protein [Clostridia bacterium]
MRNTFDRMVSGAIGRIALLGCHIPSSGLIAGPEKIDNVIPFPCPEAWDMGEDNNHYPLNYAFLIENGIPALIARARAGMANAPAEENRLRLDAIIRFLEAYRSYILSHAALAASRARLFPEDAERYNRIAQNCRALTEGAPQTFEQAVQLFYFTWRLRSVNYTSCIGRLDVQLGGAYRRSIAEGMPRSHAHDILCELIRKLNAMGSGDTLMNAMLGGVDEDGNDVSSDLSVLIMECCGELALSEPHINVRYHAGTPDFFKRATEKLVSYGQGQGTLYVDEHIIPELVRMGVPLNVARCYANDGCTEVTLEGSAGIFFWQMESMKTLELALHNGKESPNAPHTPVRKWSRHRMAMPYNSQLTLGFESGDMRRCETFEEVMACFYRQYDYQIALYLERISDEIRRHKEGGSYQTSLLSQCMIPGVLDTGREPVRGGFESDNYQLLSGSIPTVADSLYAVKEAVFEQKLCTMDELLRAIDADFEGHELLQKQLRSLPKFGNDEDGVDLLASEIAAHFCGVVEAYAYPCGMRVLPGIYNIDFVMFSSILGATPDGRNAGDAICCHYSPTPSRATKGITAALQSASKGNLPRGCAASPVYLTLPRLIDTDYTKVISALFDGCAALRLPIVNLSIVNVEELEDARIHPENHRDLIVRVWGYNAYFVDLDDELQLHIINRTLHTA